MLRSELMASQAGQATAAPGAAERSAVLAGLNGYVLSPIARRSAAAFHKREDISDVGGIPIIHQIRMS
jgi:hypothetical protein